MSKDGFRGAPIFADARQVDAATSDRCRITNDPSDPQGLIYDLEITDLAECGVLKKNVSNSNSYLYIQAISDKSYKLGFCKRADMVPPSSRSGDDV